MAKALTLRQAALVFAWFIGASVLLFAGPMLADRYLLHPYATAAMRWAGVAISVLSIVPWLAYVGWGLSIADEYHRRTLVVGTAVAFAIAIVFQIAMQLLADAALVTMVVTIDLPIAFVLWAIGVAGATVYFTLRP